MNYSNANFEADVEEETSAELEMFHSIKTGGMETFHIVTRSLEFELSDFNEMDSWARKDDKSFIKLGPH